MGGKAISIGNAVTTWWPNRSFIAFDTETTGLDFENDCIIEAAIAVFVKGQHVWQFDWLLNRPEKSNQEAVDIHGITDEYRWENGEDAKPVFQHIQALLRRCVRGNSPIVVFNAPFDFSMLQQDFQRYKLDFAWDGLHVIDPLVIDRHFQKNIPIFTKPHMRQQQMAIRYGVAGSNHRALDDAICAGNIALAQTLHYPSIRHISPAELHRTQEKWFDEFCGKVRKFTTDKNIEGFSLPPWPFGILPTSVLGGV